MIHRNANQSSKLKKSKHQKIDKRELFMILWIPKTAFYLYVSMKFLKFMAKRDTPPFPLQHFFVSSRFAMSEKFFEVYLSKIFNNNY